MAIIVNRIKRVSVYNAIGGVLLVFFFLNPLLLPALDPEQPIDNYLLEHWTTRSGLPNMSVYNICQSSDDYMWIDTEEEVVRFDGRRFTYGYSLRPPASQLTPPDVWATLFTDHDGMLWLSGKGRMILYRDNRYVQAIPFKKKFDFDAVHMATRDSSGNVWLGMGEGILYCMRGGEMVEYGPEQGIPGHGISCVMEDKSGQLFVAAFREGIFKLGNDRFSSVTIEGLDPATAPVNWLYQDRSGAMWIATGNGLIRKDGDDIRHFSTADGLSDNTIVDVIEDSDGNIWLGTDSGLNRLRMGANGAVRIDHRLENDMINVLYEDREKNLWIGTNGSGLKRLRNSLFRIFTVREDSQDYISSIHRARNDDIWVATVYGDLVRVKDNRIVERFKLDDYIHAIEDDRDGNIWVGTENTGLVCITRDRSMKRYAEELISRKVPALFSDSNNTLWIGTRYGLNTLKDGKFASYDKKVGLPDDWIFSFQEMEGGDIRMNCTDGIYNFKGGKVTKESTRHVYKKRGAAFVLSDDEGTRWIASMGTGLVRERNGKYFYYNKKMRLPGHAVYRIIDDGGGFFWLSTNDGIIRLNRNELNQFADGKIKTLNARLFAEKDGLKSAECVGTAYNSAIMTPDGELWFTTKKGVAIIRPENVLINKVPPRTIIEQVKMNGEPIKVAEGESVFEPKLKTRKLDSIKFYFTAAALSSQDGVLFKFKLDGYDHDWIFLDVGERRVVEYRNLVPGDYKFQVTACNSDGVWSPRGTDFTFVVPVSFFRSTVFKVGAGVVVFLLGMLVYWFYSHRFKVVIRRKQESPGLNGEKAEKDLNRLIKLLEREKVYRDENVSLNSLSKRLDIHPRQLSHIINEKLDKSFTDLINQYRVEEAKRQLMEEEEPRTILDIAYDVGFTTKSTFNRAFKKFTHVTPSQFRNKYSRGNGTAGVPG